MIWQNLLKEDFKMNLWFPHLIKFVLPCKIWEFRISDKNESVTTSEQHLELIPKLQQFHMTVISLYFYIYFALFR